MDQIGFLFTITDFGLLWLCGWQPRAHHVLAAAEGGPSVLVDGGTHAEEVADFAGQITYFMTTHSFAVNQPVVAGLVAGSNLQDRDNTPGKLLVS